MYYKEEGTPSKVPGFLPSPSGGEKWQSVKAAPGEEREQSLVVILIPNSQIGVGPCGAENDSMTLLILLLLFAACSRLIGLDTGETER